jgi:hypothetical protein
LISLNNSISKIPCIPGSEYAEYFPRTPSNPGAIDAQVHRLYEDFPNERIGLLIQPIDATHDKAVYFDDWPFKSSLPATSDVTGKLVNSVAAIYAGMGNPSSPNTIMNPSQFSSLNI